MVNSPAAMRCRQFLREVGHGRFAIGGDEIAERGEERHMRQNVGLDAVAERVLPDRREARKCLLLLLAQLFVVALTESIHVRPALYHRRW